MKKIISLAVSLGVLALIYWKIDIARLGPVFAGCDGWWMFVSLAMVVPLTLLTSWRFQQLAPAEARVSFAEANRLILSASVLNLVLPSKMGDIAKALFIPGLRRSLALSLVVFEKACDMLSLLAWCVFGLAWVWLTKSKALHIFDMGWWSANPAFHNTMQPTMATFHFLSCFFFVVAAFAFGSLMLGSRRVATEFFTGIKRLITRIGRPKLEEKIEKLSASWGEMQSYFLATKSRLALVCATSLFIWLLHLLQIWFFILALRAWCPFLANLALSPLAILAGLFPLTFAGVGTRDAALILLYAPYFPAPTAAALGILCTVRYVLPAIGGIPFFQKYLATVRQQKAAPARTP